MPSQILVVPRTAFNEALAEECFRCCWIAHLGLSAVELGLPHEALYHALTRMQRAGYIFIEGASLTLR